MPLTREQAEAAFDAATAPARELRARRAAIRERKRHQVMPRRWRLFASLFGVAVGAIVYWFALGQRLPLVVPLCMVLSVNLAQARWNRQVKRCRIDQA
jgi:fatty acid desaturase